MKVSRLTIPYGEPGTDATVRIMREMIEAGKRDQAVRQLAERILRLYHVPNYQYVSELAALHDWVRRNIRYTKDPHEVEYIQTPRRLLQTRMGDCDDMAVLLGSLAEVVGHPVGIKVVSRYADKNYHHVYPVAEIDGRQYGLDASVPFPFGYQSPDIKKEKIFPSNGVGNMKSVYFGLGKTPPVNGGDGAAAGDAIPIAFGPDPRSKVKVNVLGPGARICGADVLERMRAGTIRPNLSSTRLRYLSAAESGTGVPCVIAEEIGVYERPIEPVVPGLPPPMTITPGAVLPPRGMLEVSVPITLQYGQRLCRPDVRTLLREGLVKAGTGTVLRTSIDAATGTPCVAAVVPTDVKPTEPDIFIPPPDVVKPGRPGDPRVDDVTRPEVYMPPGTRPIYRPTTETDLPPGIAPGAVVEAAAEEGPLGLPWIVWIGAAGLLVTVLMKK